MENHGLSKYRFGELPWDPIHVNENFPLLKIRNYFMHRMCDFGSFPLQHILLFTTLLFCLCWSENWCSWHIGKQQHGEKSSQENKLTHSTSSEIWENCWIKTQICPRWPFFLPSTWIMVTYSHTGWICVYRTCCDVFVFQAGSQIFHFHMCHPHDMLIFWVTD